MDREKQFDDELTHLEQDLSRLVPKAGRLNHARVLYLAGRASAAAERSREKSQARWFWPLATMATSLAAVAFAVLWSMPREPVVVEKIVYVQRPSQPEAGDDVQSSDAPQRPAEEEIQIDSWSIRETHQRPARPRYLQTRQIALQHGVDELPKLDGGGQRIGPASYRELQEKLIGRLMDADNGDHRVEPREGDNT